MRADPAVALATETARLAVEAGAAAALRHFRTDLEIALKDDRSPVTQADRDAERAILDVIRRVFPEHATLAEESGTAGAGRDRWIVDPLDGTKGFSRGGSFWGPLVAYERDGAVLAGAMALPALGETYWAGRGLGAWRDAERLRVSSTATWEEATLSLGEMRFVLAPPFGDGVRSLVATAASSRCYGDLAGAAMLLQGKADAWIEAGVRPWDIGPIAILVAEAGGRFTDIDGNAAPLGDHAVATNGLLHEHVLAALRAF